VARRLNQLFRIVKQNGTMENEFRDFLNWLEDQVSASDYYMEVAQGNIRGAIAVNKFGRTDNVDNGVDTDIWTGSDAAIGNVIWDAPTTARTHQITSTSTNDVATTGTGARKVQIYGLTDWDTAEVSEIIDMPLSPATQATSNQYVIIHRMKVTEFGASGPNIGQITATADGDGTVTAYIAAGIGQTEMAIYGVPSTQTAYLRNWYISANKTGVGSQVNGTLLVAPSADTEETVFLVKETIGIGTAGVSAHRQEHEPPTAYPGPCIIKVQGNATANDTDVSAGFDLVVKNN
jgi:hypothetical protein